MGHNYREDQIYSNFYNMVQNALLVGTFVNIMGGKYKGEQGKLLKLMEVMCQVKLENKMRVVNVYQSNVACVTNYCSTRKQEEEVGVHLSHCSKDRVGVLEEMVLKLQMESQQHLTLILKMTAELKELRQEMNNLVKLVVEVQLQK